jgi:hypothetical protein
LSCVSIELADRMMERVAVELSFDNAAPLADIRYSEVAAAVFRIERMP